MKQSAIHFQRNALLIMVILLEHYYIIVNHGRVVAFSIWVGFGVVGFPVSPA